MQRDFHHGLLAASLHCVLQQPTERVEVAAPPVDPAAPGTSRKLIDISASPRPQLGDDIRLRDGTHQIVAPKAPAERPDRPRQVDSAEHL